VSCTGNVRPDGAPADTEPTQSESEGETLEENVGAKCPNGSQPSQIDIWDNGFPITCDMVLRAVLDKREAIRKQKEVEKIGLRASSIMEINGREYYVIAGYYAGDPDAAFTFGHYCVDAHTGETFEMVAHDGCTLLLPIGEDTSANG
jgi:hypothetical protein